VREAQLVVEAVPRPDIAIADAMPLIFAGL
jgi:hypothetical protein